MSISKAQLIDAIAKENDLSKAKAKQAIDLTLWAISKALTKGQDVTIIGFGSFKIVERSERMGFNPKTGAKIKIASKKVVRFKPGNDLSGQVK
jgi:DNA-binding protein HU-beta